MGGKITLKLIAVGAGRDMDMGIFTFLLSEASTRRGAWPDLENLGQV